MDRKKTQKTLFYFTNQKKTCFFTTLGESGTDHCVHYVYKLETVQNGFILIQTAFLLPVLTGILQNVISSCLFSKKPELQAIIVGPTREDIQQNSEVLTQHDSAPLCIVWRRPSVREEKIFNKIQKFSHNTIVHPCALHGGVQV